MKIYNTHKEAKTEAMHYVQNAEETFKKSHKKSKFYSDKNMCESYKMQCFPMSFSCCKTN